MRILAFDTATGATTVAICHPEIGLALELRDDPPPGERPGHATRLLPMIAELLGLAGGGWEEVDRIAVGVGPGTFTGLRIGIATARALAWAREIPLVGVSSLEALGTGATLAGEGHDGRRAVIAAIDARRGEVFAAAWRGSDQVIDPSALRPEALALEVERMAGADGAAPLVIGDGALRFSGQLEVARAEIPPEDSPLHRISAINHGRLAAGRSPTSPSEVEPAYLRMPDAQIADIERHSRPK